MIFVDRSKRPPPKRLLREAELGLREIRSFLMHRGAGRSQREFPFDHRIYRNSDVVKALLDLFESRCAFCESMLAENAEVVHFRPASRAMALNGDVSPEHYWWLVYEWQNLYPACIDCYKAKGTRFPIARQRANPEAAGRSLDVEGPLLVDPCTGSVGQAFATLTDGALSPWSREGEKTIEIFALNRPQLVEARRKHSAIVRKTLRSLVGASLTSPRKRFESQVRRLMGRHPFLSVSLRAANQMLAEARLQTRTLSERRAPPGHNVRSTPRINLRPSATWLHRVEIENFRALQEIRLEFPSLEPSWSRENLDGDDQEPWIVLLGNNGVGKSSLLKAIALALAPTGERNRLAPNPRALITEGRGQANGAIRLWFTGNTEPVELSFGRHRKGFRTRGNVPPIPTLAYGATRLLPPPTRRAKTLTGRSRIGNLFNPIFTLNNGEEWLADRRLVDQSNFDLLSTDLKSLLSLEESEYIQRENRQLIARLFRKQLPIRELSDGFQSVLALALDMMYVLSSKTHNMRGVEALVLLDEIEVHLHPTWRARIVRDFRKMFPRTRFIVTTHDPLCVQGLAPGELHVMRRNDRSKRVEVYGIDVPGGLRSDQILTGDWFGLGSTRDPATLKLIESHRDLLLVEAPTGEQKTERLRIEQELRLRLGQFADSPYERAGLRAYAELAPQLHDVPLIEQQERIRNRIRQLLQTTNASIRRPT